ncbi:MAG: efflux RND transporter permease subunit, partial [Pseudobdellovibrionaceae bacterium]
MNLVDLSIRRPVFAWILMFGLIIFGAICLNRIGISQMPDVDFPILDISVRYEGAAPEVVETELIDRIEERLLSIEGVKEMRSSVRQGGGSIRLEFGIERNVDVALQEVQSAISTLRLPEEVDPPVVRKQNPEEDPIMIIGIYGDMEPKELINWTQNFLLDQLRFLPNVGEVSGWGFSQRSVRVWPDPKKLSRLELAITDILGALRTQHFESAVGQFVENDKEYRVRWLGEAATVDEVANIRILQRGGQNIQERDLRIKDVAEVEDGLSDVRRIAQIQGKTAFGIGVRKQRGANEIDVARVIEAKLKELKPQFPKGVDYQINMDFTKSTKATVHTTVEKLFAAALVTILICFLFLGNMQSAINILFSIPTSIVGTFIIIYFSGFTLNLFSLLALTLAISIVVDDAIMLLENIVRHFNMGKTATQAASEGSKEVMPAAIAATLAVIAIFIPVVFLDGVIGKFFFQFGITMSAAVLLSLLEAATITPMRAAFLMKRHTKASRFEKFLDHFFEGLAHRYLSILIGIVRWKGTVVAVSTLIFIISLTLITKVRQEFVPAQDQDLIQLSGQAPPGTDLLKTYEAARKVEEIVKKHPDIERHFLSVGAGGPSANTNNFNMPLMLKPQAERKKKHTEIMDELRAEFKNLKGIRVTMRDISTRNLASGRSNPLSFNLRG